MLTLSYANRPAFHAQNQASALRFEGKNKKKKQAPKQDPQPSAASEIRTMPAADELVKSAEKPDTKTQEQSNTPAEQAPEPTTTQAKQPSEQSETPSEQALKPSNEPEKSISESFEVESPEAERKPEQMNGDEPNWEAVSESGDEEPAVAVERPETTDYLQWCDERKTAELLAIGKRFAVPGRVLNGMENQAKSWSRSLVDKSRSIATGATNMVCDKAVSTLKASARAIENWQHSGKQ